MYPLRPDVGWSCAAFPRGILKQIMVNMADHREPYRGDRGIRWEAREDLPRADANDGPKRAAGVLFVTPDRRVLLMRRSAGGSYDHDHPGEWSIPGGGIEDGETDAEAAAREVEEETGFCVPASELQEWTRSVKNGVDFSTFVCVISEEFVPKLNSEHDNHSWVDLDGLLGKEQRLE